MNNSTRLLHMDGDPSQLEMEMANASRPACDRHEDVQPPGASWYSNRKDIEENSPSRRDGIDLKKETYLRKSYCAFLQDLGMRLKFPQVTIATAIVFCHRFFLRQSHGKNDRRTIATVCMFLAGKVEETPWPLKEIILVSYEIIHKKDPVAIQRIRQKEVYEQQKELILLGERVVLATLGFDLNVQHPYKPLVEAIKKFKIAQNALAQVAWNFVNDGYEKQKLFLISPVNFNCVYSPYTEGVCRLRTSLFLQFKPHHIAAGAIFLAAKFLKVKLPSDGEKFWWQEFDVNPRQLEEMSNQMLELYEQYYSVPTFCENETEGCSASAANHHARTEVTVDVEEPTSQNGYSHASRNTTAESSCLASSSTRSQSEQFHLNKHVGRSNVAYNNGNGHVRDEKRTGISDKKATGTKGSWHHEPVNSPDIRGSRSLNGTEQAAKEFLFSVTDTMTGTRERTTLHSEGSKVHSPIMDAIKKIDKNKVKAALEKRRKSRPNVPRMVDFVDDDDLIERELEDGVALAVEIEQNKPKNHSYSKPSYKQEPQRGNNDSENTGEQSVVYQENQLSEHSNNKNVSARHIYDQHRNTPLKRQNAADNLHPAGRFKHCRE